MNSKDNPKVVSKREQRKLQIKKTIETEIINIAEQLFISNGYDKTKMDEIAKQAEYTKKTIYSYFKNKEHLYNAVILNTFKNMNKYFELNHFKINNKKTGLKKIIQLGKIFIEYASEHSQQYKLIIEYQNSDDCLDHEDEYLKECSNISENQIELLNDLIVLGIKDGSIRQDVKVKETCLTLWAFVVGIITVLIKKNNYVNVYYEMKTENLIKEAISLIENTIKK